MAEAVRKKRSRIKVVSEKCSVPERREKEEEEETLEELLREYGDTPLPSLLDDLHTTAHTQSESQPQGEFREGLEERGREGRTQGELNEYAKASVQKGDLQKRKESQSKGEVSAKMHVIEEGESNKSSKESEKQKQAKESQSGEKTSEHENRTNDKRDKETEECGKQEEKMNLPAPTFVNLHQELRNIEPYFQAQQELKNLVISEGVISRGSYRVNECLGEDATDSSPVECKGKERLGKVSEMETEYTSKCVQNLSEHWEMKEENEMRNESVVSEDYEERERYLMRGRQEAGSEVLASAPVLHDTEDALPSVVDVHSVVATAIQTEEAGVKTKIKLPEEGAIHPMSEVQLNALYQNTELEENDGFISQFVSEERSVPQLEFYEIVLGYLRARTSLIGSQKELATIQEEYNKQKKNVWVFEKRTATEEGECEDSRLLTVKQEYVVACYKGEIAAHISKLLKQTREVLSDSYALHAYEAEMCKLQVENYMQKVLSECPDFARISKNARVSGSSEGRRQHPAHLRPHIDKLHTCISVLFEFQRRGVKDQQFVRDTRQWLTDLVAVLLRVATVYDHLFLLNHVLRCPPGLGTWAPAYIQIGGGWDTASGGDGGGGMLGCWGLDHTLTVLATVLSPVPARHDFLHHLRYKPVTGEGVEGGGDGVTAQDSVWVVVDSSGEEEEDPTQLWSAFNENDVIQLVNQVPFKSLFQHMLLVCKSGGSLHYDPLQTSHHGFLKLFALATRLVQLFRKGLITYSQMRYRGATKRICRLLRHTIEYVTEHWQAFLASHHLTPHHRSHMLQPAPHWAALQVEYDRLFEGAVNAMFSCPRSGAWQFLAVIPYTSVSLTCLWKIVYQLHVGVGDDKTKAARDSNELRTGTGRGSAKWAELVGHRDTRGQFHDRLVVMDENEAYYILSALAHMTSARESSEMEFIEVVVKNLFEASFVHEGTREMLSRNGRDLLASVAVQHPVTMSLLLTATQDGLSSVGSMALYLFRALPLEVWVPSECDVTCLAHWLLFMGPHTTESHLARVILDRLNWGLDSSGTRLALSHDLHRKVALTVLEAHTKICGDMYTRSLLTEGVKQVTSVMYAPPPEKVFDEWSWRMLSRLRLHRLDQPEAEVRAVLACPASLLRHLPDPTSPAITQGSQMHVLKRSLVEKKPLALFSALLLTTWGHSIPEICERGVECIHELVIQGRYEAAITALAHITPLFFSQPEDLITNTKLMVGVQKILSADQTYLSLAKSLVVSACPGKILTLFAAMILNHITNYTRYGLGNGAGGVRFWMQLLVDVPEWVKDGGALYLLDTICQHAFTHPQLWNHVLQAFSDVTKECEQGSDNGSNNTSSSGGGGGGSGGGGVLGLLSWLTSSSSSGGWCSLLVRASAPQFPWFTLAALSLDTQREMSSGLWPGLLTRLYSDPNITLEQALKDVEGVLGLGNITSSSQLSIYRWGQQVVDLPHDHAALPVTLQMYLTLHLARVPPRPGNYECGSVVDRFYQGFVNSGFLAKIKKKVLAAAEHLEKRLSQLTQEDEMDEDSTVIRELGERVSLVRGMCGWLEETRLYEPGVYLPALPPHLLPHRLTSIFQANWEPWPEAVDRQATEESERKLLRVWEGHRQGGGGDASIGSPSASPRHQRHPAATPQPLDPRAAILRRLDTYEPPQPPPKVAPRTPLHTPRLEVKTMVDREALLTLARRYTSVVVEHSAAVNLWSNEMCALDCVYVELLPSLWVNTNTKAVLSAQCKPPKIGRTQPECSGHASIVMEYSEARVRERETARAEQNREQREAVLQRCQKPPPLQLCQAAVSLEAIITSLITAYRHTTTTATESQHNNQQQQRPLLLNGRQLFYDIVQLTSDDTCFYPPAKQLIASCAQVLGQEFVSGHEECQELLVGQVVELGGRLGGHLAPHFTPAATPTHTFLTLYASLAPHAPRSPDHIFMLLSKFDLERWLSVQRPSISDRTQLLNLVEAALSALLPSSTPPLLPVLELYRIHLRTLLDYRFPEHYSQVLTSLLHLSGNTLDDIGSGVGEGLWYDLINTLAAGVSTFTPGMDTDTLLNTIREFAHHQTRLSHSMIEDTLKQVSSYFVEQRLECGLYGLYPRYRPYVQALALFLCLLSHAYIASVFRNTRATVHSQLVREVWWAVEGLWAGWVAPLGGQEREGWPGWLRGLTRDVPLLLPWTPSDANTADSMMALFSASLHYMHDLIPGRCEVLGLTLEYYSNTFASREVKSHVLVVIHAHLAPLPWHHLYPSLQHTLIFSKVVEQYLPECHSFIGSILIQINWSRVLEAALNSTPTHQGEAGAGVPSGRVESPEPGDAVARLHTCLLNLLVRLSMEPSVRQTPQLPQLLEEAEGWGWWSVDGESFQRVVNWWVMSCDPRIVLALPDPSPVDLAVIR
ncbi:hypothetical protein Pmani_002518 [Petrolisthes manimaculis]|uniref:Ectopic P granules protein 5 homolog n=1 Tax=Petrolisthes manimaculis TaxID=1843537 RepID=A0AAE1QHV0_9EUCA|nr:hypothetical protein Pmani_002518 [Petrolisthes manimaculis]